MSRRGRVLVGSCAAAAVAGAAVLRSEGLVLAIRRLDRRLERDHAMFGARHARLWTAAPRAYRGLHRRAAIDVARAIPRPDGTVVDIGAGTGALGLLLGESLPGAHVVGIEPSDALRAVAVARGLRVLDGRAESIPLPAASVDVAVSTLSSHHWDDPAAALAEMRRVLRPGGQGRIYDVRFAGLTAREVREAAGRAGLPEGCIDRRVLDEGPPGLRPYSLVTIQL